MGAGAILMAVFGFVATFAGIGGFRSNDTSGAMERVAFAYSTVAGGPQDLPMSVDEAESAGWSGSALCIPLRGQLLQKVGR